MIVRSRSADVTVPDVSITEYVMRQARRLGDKPAIIDRPTGRVVTYRELDEAIRRVATGLARRGVRQGDVVAIYSPNCPEYVVSSRPSPWLNSHDAGQSAVHSRRAGRAASRREGALPHHLPRS